MTLLLPGYHLQLAKRTGVEIQVVPETAEGDIDLAALEALILQADRPRPRLISITHVPTSSGRVYDAAGVGRLARKHSVLFMLDACQSVGQLPVDVRGIGCDFATGTGRKFLRAPRGSGFLFCARHALAAFEPAAIDNTGAAWGPEPDQYSLAPTARRFEQYEMSFASKVRGGDWWWVGTVCGLLVGWAGGRVLCLKSASLHCAAPTACSALASSIRGCLFSQSA